MSEPFTIRILRGLSADYRRPQEKFTWIPSQSDRRQAEANHYQTLERLEERGGVGWCELAAIVEHRQWLSMDTDAARTRCCELHPQ